MTRLTLLVIFFTALCAPARAQTIEFDPPETVTLREDALSVVFRDGVDVAEARKIVEEVNPLRLSVRFRTVVVTAVTDSMPSDAAVSELLADRRVLTFNLSPRPQPSVSATRSYRIQVRIDPSVSASEASVIVEEVNGFTVTNVKKSPNEIEIELSSEDPDIVDALEDRPEVKYVAYLSTE